MNSQINPKHELGQNRRSAMVLVVVLVVIAVLTLASYTFSELMLTEHQATRVVARQAQARALAESGAELLRIFVSQTSDGIMQGGGTYDNTSQFQGMLVYDDGTTKGRGRFSVVAPRIENGVVTGVRYGLENESARLNINALAQMEKQKAGTGKQMLMVLPGMDDSIADAILDWLDADSDTRDNGAEADYYAGLSPPYAPKNGPLDTIEELLLVRGVTPQLLFGADANRNGFIDAGEQNLPQIADGTNADPETNRGWAAYLTLYSKEANLQPDDTLKFDLNMSDLQALHDDLSSVFSDEWVNFILAYRLYGGTAPTQSANGSSGNSSGTQSGGQSGNQSGNQQGGQQGNQSGNGQNSAGGPYERAPLSNSRGARVAVSFGRVSPSARRRWWWWWRWRRTRGRWWWRWRRRWRGWCTRRRRGRQCRTWRRRWPWGRWRRSGRRWRRPWGWRWSRWRWWWTWRPRRRTRRPRRGTRWSCRRTRRRRDGPQSKRTPEQQWQQ